MRIHKVHIIAEGPSEKAYFTHLSRICRELSLPLLFEAYPSGGNHPKKIKLQWNKAQVKRDKKNNEEVWAVLDYDSFLRGQLSTRSFSFAGQNLYFFIINFEDFLVHHLEISYLKKWKNICQRSNHFQSPMHGAEVVREIQQIFAGYSKGTMPLTLCKSHLNCVESNCSKFFVSPGAPDFIPMFIGFLKQKHVI